MYSYKETDVNTNQSELKVTDWFYEDIGYASSICCNWIIISVINYKKILQSIADDVVMSGSTHDALVEYTQIFEDFIEITRGLGEQYRLLCTNFVDEIDQWDDFVYSKGKRGKVVRDFSDTAFRDIKSSLNGSILTLDIFKPLDPYINGAINGGKDLYWKIATLIDESRKCRSSYIANQSNLKKCNKDKLKKIFDRVRGCDTLYAKKFGMLYDELEKAYEILKKTDMVMEKKMAFNASSISDIKGMVNNLRILKETVDTKLEINYTGDPTIEDIENFVGDFTNQHVFLNFSSDLNSFVYDISAGDVFLMGILQGSSIITTHYGTLTIPPEVPKEKHYEYVMLKKQLSEIIADMSESDIEISAESYELAKDIISKIKDSKHFVSDYQKYKEIYDTLYKSVGALEDGLGIGLDFSEIIVSMFADYLENEKIIASLAGSAGEGSLLNIATQQLQAEYKNFYLRGTVKFFDFASTTMASEIMKEGSKKLLSLAGSSAGSLYSLASFGIKTVGEMSGVSENVGSKLEFCTLFNSLSDIESAYKENFNNVATGNKSEQDILNLKNSFEILKRTYSELYNLMGNSVGATGDINKKAYYHYVAREINNSSIVAGIKEVVSYDDFLNNKMFE